MSTSKVDVPPCQAVAIRDPNYADRMCRLCGGSMLHRMAEKDVDADTRRKKIVKMAPHRLICEECCYNMWKNHGSSASIKKFFGATKEILHAQASLHQIGDLMVAEGGDKTRNFCFSPINLTQTLSLLNDFGGPEVRKEIGSLVPWAGTYEYARDLADYPDRYATFLFSKENLDEAVVNPVIKKFTTTWQRAHFPSVSEANALIAERTHGEIKNIIPQNAFDSADLMAVIVSTLYFNCKWFSPIFKEQETKPTTFYNADSTMCQCKMMHAKASLPFYDEDDLVGVVIPLKTDIPNPNKGNGEFDRSQFDNTIQHLSAVFIQDRSKFNKDKNDLTSLSSVSLDKFYKVVREASPGDDGEINFYLPRFEVKPNTHNMIGPLKKANCGAMFGANCKNPLPTLCSGGAFVSMFIHAAMLRIDENGAVGAAASVVLASRCFRRRGPPTIRFDRPFFACIYDTDTGDQLISARVNNLSS